MSISYANIGKNIKYARQAMNLTQEQAAELIGISQLHFGRLERGERRISLDRLAEIAEKLDTTLPALLSGVHPDLPHFTTLTQEHLTFGENLAYLAANTSPKLRQIMLAVCKHIIELES